MADPPPSTAAISAAFPAPPPFYKSFTQANLTRLSSLQISNPSLTPSDLPPNLRPLLPPPPPPPSTSYRTFNTTTTTDPSPPSPATTVATAPPPAAEPPPNPHRLLQTTRLLLLRFLSLTDSLATEPETWAPKWDEMRALFSEAHGVVNEYRPHQARERLIFMMEERVERGRKEMGEVREVCGKVRGVIEGVERGEGEGVRGVRDVGWKEAEKLGNGERERERERGKSLVQEKRMWEVIEDEVGGFD